MKKSRIPALTLGWLAEMLQRGGGEKNKKAQRTHGKQRNPLKEPEVFFRGSLLIPTVFPPRRTRPLPGNQLLEPGGQKGGGDVLYQDCESQFPRSVFFLTAVWLG